MDVIEIARNLGVALQQDERYKRYFSAKLKNDNDTVLQNAIGEFNMIRMEMDRELGKGDEKDEAKMKDLNEKLRKAYAAIMMTESMTEYNQAKTALDALVGEVETIISAAISGEDPLTCDTKACTHDCSTCGGCH